MAYRAFFALPAENFTTASGQHTNAIYGFATMLISLLKEEKPTHIAVAFDVSRKTFRTEIFPDYKANRAKTPDEFRSQMSYLHELVASFGITQFEREGFEADDIIATIAKQAEADGFEVAICTGDRDSFQLVNEKTTVLYPKRGVSEMARMTPAAVEEKYMLTPAQYPDFAALRGDPSDNLPSVPGVGEKTAAKWIIEYGSLKELLNKADQVPGKAGESLRANLESIAKNRELTQLIHDVKNNYTRFLILQQSPSEVEGANKASINFHTDHAKGRLSEVLTMIANEDINLSKLQSFPIAGSKFKYGFHADLEFEAIGQYKKLIGKLEKKTAFLRVLGVYKKGKFNKWDYDQCFITVEWYW